MSELDQYAEAVRREWSKYVATEQIFIGGALAFNDGDPVPAGHVDREDAPVRKDQVKPAKAAAATNKEG